MNAVVSQADLLAVEAVPGVAVGEDEVFRAGRHGHTHLMTFPERMGQLCGPDRHRIYLARLHEFRMLKLVPVAHAHNSVRQLHGTSVFIHIGDPHHQICIFAVGGEIDHSLGISGDGKFLLQNSGGIAEHIGPLLLVCVVFRHLQFIFRHIDDMGGRIFRIVCKMIPTFIFRSREAEGSMACFAAASGCHIRGFAVQVEGHP